MADEQSKKSPEASTAPGTGEEKKESDPSKAPTAIEGAPPPGPGNAAVPAKGGYMPLSKPPPRRRGGIPCIGGCFRKPPFPPVGKDDPKDPNFGRMLAAECVGTMFLVFFGVMSVVTSAKPTSPTTFPVKICNGPSPPPTCAKNPRVVDGPFWFIDDKGENYTYYYFVGIPNTLHISFGFGIAVATIAQAFGHISGAHLNPAVTLGLMMAGKCSLIKALCYFIFQLIGGIIGSFLVWLSSKHLRIENEEYKATGKIATFSDYLPNWGMGASTLREGVAHFPDGCACEFTLTFLLVFTVCSVCDDMRKDIKGSAPLAIGLAVFVCHAAGIGFTGSSVNPARSFGPAIFSSAEKRWEDHWVYWLGPVCGGIEAGATYACFFNEKGEQADASRQISPETMSMAPKPGMPQPGAPQPSALDSGPPKTSPV